MHAFMAEDMSQDTACEVVIMLYTHISDILAAKHWTSVCNGVYAILNTCHLKQGSNVSKCD